MCTREIVKAENADEDHARRDRLVNDTEGDVGNCPSVSIVAQKEGKVGFAARDEK
jgi:hypothetical protein